MRNLATILAGGVLAGCVILLTAFLRAPVLEPEGGAESPDPLATEVEAALGHPLPQPPRERDASGALVEQRVERYRSELRAFADDLERTDRVGSERARGLATIAVTESYRHGIPPALVLGVMLVENSGFSSTAKSSVGARGLMQIMPNVWLESLGPIYGWDLADDRVNIAMGVHILAHYYHRAARDWRAALLRYNGCVRGTNTPNCFEYPDMVRRRVEQNAKALCARQGFERCVTRRLHAEFNPRAVGG